MDARIRYYHPDHPPTWGDRLYDFFSIAEVPPRPPGVDYSFLDRMVGRSLRELVDGVVSIDLLGADVAHVDTRLRLPDEPAARRELAAEIVRRLAFGQVQADGRRVPLPIRWVELRPTPDGTRVIVRLRGRADPALRSFLAAHVGPRPDGAYAGSGRE